MILKERISYKIHTLLTDSSVIQTSHLESLPIFAPIHVTNRRLPISRVVDSFTIMRTRGATNSGLSI